MTPDDLLIVIGVLAVGALGGGIAALVVLKLRDHQLTLAAAHSWREGYGQRITTQRGEAA